jgi:hypothetical protein
LIPAEATALPITEPVPAAGLLRVLRGEFGKGGMDPLRLEGDRIAEVWSVTGGRLL